MTERSDAPDGEPKPVDATDKQNLFRWGVLFKGDGPGFYLNVAHVEQVAEVRVRGVRFVPAPLSEIVPQQEAWCDGFMSAALMLENDGPEAVWAKAEELKSVAPSAGISQGGEADNANAATVGQVGSQGPAPSTSAPCVEGTLTERELTLLIDYHDNQEAMAEAMDMPEASHYHALRSASFYEQREEIRRLQKVILDKMVAAPSPSER